MLKRLPRNLSKLHLPHNSYARTCVVNRALVYHSVRNVSQTTPVDSEALAKDSTVNVKQHLIRNSDNSELQNTFYQRKLPEQLIKISTPNGKQLFREAMDAGQTEGFFPLTGAFASQSSPSYCGPSSLALVLNALNVDPKKIWKGAWRWYSDEMLQCCSPKEQMQKNGITFDQFACLAKCHCSVVVKRASKITYEEFLEDLKKVTATSDQHMVISFSRKTLGQTGDGHFSPIGGFHPDTNMALVLDTARFKYPSYWCSAKVLYESLMPIDKETGLSRGYFILSYDDLNPPVSLCQSQTATATPPFTKPERTIPSDTPPSACTSAPSINTNTKLNWSALAKVFCQKIPEDMWVEKPQTLKEVVNLVLRNIPREYSNIIGQRVTSSSMATATDTYIDMLFKDTSASPLYPIVHQAIYPSSTSEKPDSHAVFATLFLLGSPRMLYTSLPRDLQKLFDHYRSTVSSMPLVKREVDRISVEIIELTKSFCTCGKPI
ncbi:Phytochelatin synthase-domain-containing protein [Umbelopsis sp. AD052]|nr:Phytochelatin synthase-domain-containing protein [Umbelopsis sp. AD052]